MGDVMRTLTNLTRLIGVAGGLLLPVGLLSCNTHSAYRTTDGFESPKPHHSLLPNMDSGGRAGPGSDRIAAEPREPDPGLVPESLLGGSDAGSVIDSGASHTGRSDTSVAPLPSVAPVNQARDLDPLLATEIRAQRPVWFADTMTHDLTGDGRKDTLIIMATGRQVDRLNIVLTIVADSAEYRDSWHSGAYYHDVEGNLDPDQAIRSVLAPRMIGRLELGASFREDEALRLIARQIDGGTEEAREVFREMCEKRVPYFVYGTGIVSGFRVAWSPTKKRFLVFQRMG